MLYFEIYGGITMMNFWKRHWLKIVFVTAAVIVLVSPIIPVLGDVWFFGDEQAAGGATRTIIFALGALGGLYGLIVAARRLDVNERGLFNDRLSRAVEALGHEDSAVKMSGWHLINSLIKESEPGSDDEELLLKILNEYVSVMDDIGVSEGDENDDES